MFYLVDRTRKKYKSVVLFLTGCVCMIFLSCTADLPLEPVQEYPGIMEMPAHFPEMIIPEDNQFTKARWLLGKKLFYDPVLSVDSSISCATCHHQSLSFSDGLATSEGVAGRKGFRNAPSLANIGFHPYFMREGGVPTLEMQVLVPIQEHAEFDFNIVLLAQRLSANEEYVRLAEEAYGRMPDPFVITRAIACFERSLISGNSIWDQDQYGAGEAASLSTVAQKGMELFFSERTQCASCHSGINFTNYAFENNGLYEDYEDEGRYRLTGEESDRALFKVPGLRNVALTAPYMHDGSMWSLEEVLAHYDSGGASHPNKSERIKPLALTKEEKDALISFLEALTDSQFIENPNFR